MCSTQGSHSARAAGSAAEATATIGQSRAGEIRHRGAPPGAPQNIGPPGQGGARAGKMSLERVCAAVCETHRDSFLPWHRIRTPGSSAGCSGPPAPTAGLDRASRSGLELGEWSWERKGVWKEEGRK